jgi:hypothetical protein
MALVAKIKRRNAYSATWKQDAKADRALLGNRCEQCNCGPTLKNPLHRHHIHHKARGGRDFALNYKILCKRCHEVEHRR